MPYKSEKIKISKTKYDKRIKLTEKDREEIRKKYKQNKLGYQALGREYGVSKRTIYWIVNPEKREENYKLRLKRGGWRQYYSKETSAFYAKKHRRYKQKLYIEGKIKWNLENTSNT